MIRNNAASAEALYTAFGEKNVAEMEQYLHPDMHFMGPLAELTGKQAYLESAKNFADFFKSLNIRHVLGSENTAAVIYDVELPDPIGISRAVSLMTFQGGLITKIELFYDARPFEEKKREIFS